MRVAHVALAMLGLALVLGAQGAEDPRCSNHGTMKPDNVTCACDNDIPTVGSSGWTGEHCEIPVHGIPSDGATVKGSLKEWEWECWAVPTVWTVEGWRFLTMHMTRTSEGGDPDLYGMFYSPTTTARPKDDFGAYDFSETSGGNHPQVTTKIDKLEIGSANNFTATYVCVYAYGSNVTYTLEAYGSLCPASFIAPGGPPLQCSTAKGDKSKFRHSDGCSAEGECNCVGFFKKPVETVYPGLGFEECASPTYPLKGEKEQMELDVTVDGGNWAFFEFTVRPTDNQVVVTMGAGGHGSPTLVLKHGAPPGDQFGKYDARPAYDFLSPGMETPVKEVVLDRGGGGSSGLGPGGDRYREGQWFAGVKVEGHEGSNHSQPIHLVVSRYVCPRGCNGHGECVEVNGTHSCKCQAEWFGDACGALSQQMEFGKQVEVPMKNSEYEYLKLPAISAEVASANVEMRLVFSFQSTEWEPWVTQFPAVILRHGEGNHSGVPTSEEYDYKKIMTKIGEEQHIDVCASALHEGTWRAAVYNPVSFYAINVTVRAESIATCPGNCTSEKHGACLPTGACHCNAPFLGADCSVDGAACTPNSTLVSLEGNIHCLKGCACTGAGADQTCRYPDACSDYSCTYNSKAPYMRRKKDEKVCVLDQCTADEEFSDKQAHYSCTKACNCPADGSACTLAANCTDGTVKCHYPFQPVAGQPLLCEQHECEAGTFGSPKRVDHGVCVHECVCAPGAGNSTGNSTGKCSWEDDKCRLVCDHGYMKVKDFAEKETGAPDDAIDLEGKCVPEGKGGGGGHAVLLGFSMAFLGMGVGVIVLLQHQRGAFDTLLWHAQGLWDRVRGRRPDDLASAYQGLADMGDGEEF